MGIRENTANWLTNGNLTELEEAVAVMGDELIQRGWTIEELQESVRLLELALQSQEWQLLSFQGQQEFTMTGLKQIRELCRLMYLKNPIVMRAVDLQALYVYALGVSISGRDEAINQVVQDFMDDERNQAELTTHQAQMEKEKDLQLDGNLFFRFFVNQQTGRVRVRTVDADEITEIICNPEDKAEPWFYRRDFSETSLNGDVRVKTEYYPDWRYNPVSKAISFEAGQVVWDTPVYHVWENRFGQFGVPKVYAMIDWALAFKNFLENLATVWKALSRWSAKLSTKGGKRGVAAAKRKLNTALTDSGADTNPPPVTGSVFIQGEGTDLQPFRTAGATMNAEDGRRLQLMAIMVKGFPETFYGDVSVGTLATAKSLDRPTELAISNRQELWKGVHQNIFSLVLKWAVAAPAGPLRSLARIIRERDGDEWIETVEWREEIEAAVDISFPPVVDRDLGQYVDAAIKAAAANGDMAYRKVFIRLLLTAFEVQDVDALLEEIFPEGEEGQPTEPAENSPVSESAALLAEAGAIQLQDDGIDPVLQQYYDDLLALALAANEEEIERDEFERQMERLFVAALLMAFLLGGGDLTNPEAERLLAGQRNQARESAGKLALAIYGGQYRPRDATDDLPGQTAETGRAKLENRLTLWTSQAAETYAQGQLLADSEQRYRWDLGQTIEHCGDCLALNGQVHTASEWLAAGIHPQSPDLECGGWHCDCKLTPTDEPSQGMVF